MSDSPASGRAGIDAPNPPGGPEPSDDELDIALADLIPRSFRGLKRRIYARLEEGDVPPHQARALRIIDESAVRPGELARRLRIAPRSATEVIDALAQRGLVQRQPDPADRRATIVTTTPAADAVLVRTDAMRRAAIRDYTAQMSRPDRLELVRLLSELVGTLDSGGHDANSVSVSAPRPTRN